MRSQSLVFSVLLLALSASITFAVSPTNPGDINGDNAVNAADILLIASCLGQNAATCQGGAADPNNDGSIDLYDFVSVTQRWGQTYSSGSAGLVAAYGFEEGSGNTVTDSSGNGNTGTSSGATRATGKNGQGLSFDGVSSMVTIPSSSSLSITGPITLMAWINTNDPDYGNLIMKNGISAGYGLFLEGRTYQFYAGGWSGTTTQAAPANTWTHVALTADGTNVRVYRDGALVWTRAQPSGITATTAAVILGSVNSQGYYQGTMDDVRIYSRALSQAEIQSDMNTPAGGTPPPPDTTNPTVSLTAPANGATVSGALTVSATASDNVGVAGVQFTLDGSNLGTEDTSSPYSISWTSSGTPNGQHTLGAIARDAAGNTASAATRAVTVNNAVSDSVPPTVSITAPADGASISSTTTVTATASDNVAVQSVQFLIDGANLGSADTTSPYSVSLNPASYGVGAHTLTARATDTSGNPATSAPISITIPDSTPPGASITAPTANQVLAAGTTQTTLSVTTTEAATCKYGTSSAQTYAQMPTQFTNTGGVSHSTTLSGLADGTSYTYFVRCQDTAGNPMTSSQSVSFSVASPGGGGSGSVLFFSDWRTATGTGSSAVQDGSKWTRWGGSPVLTIVSASGHGFPAGMQNALQVAMGTGSFDWVEANNKWGMPAIGESRAYRVYMRSEVSDSVSSGGGWAATHPLESQGTDGGISGNFYAFHLGSKNDGTYQFSFATAGGWPYNYLIVGGPGGADITSLNKQTTYRVEWKWTRTATSTYSLDMRIYGADDSTLLYNANSIYGWGGGTLASHSTGYPLDASSVTGIRVGINGGFSAPAGNYVYWGGFAVCSDWCGAYSASTG